mgnify:CR=1 FL=1
MTPILTVDDLWVRFPGRVRTVEAVRGVSFEVGREKLGIVGESGSGKSMTGRAILRLVPHPGQVTPRRLTFEGTDLLTASEPAMRDIRGHRIAMVLQDPKFSLNPVMPVGDQVAEAWRVHSGASWKESRRRALVMLEAVRIRRPERVYRAYPHEVSGGMGQRLMFAVMLAAVVDGEAPMLRPAGFFEGGGTLAGANGANAIDVSVHGTMLLSEALQRRSAPRPTCNSGLA